MDYAHGCELMKDFLSHNNISFNRGRANKDFTVSYYIGNELEFEETIEVLFDFVHTDYTRNISFLDNSFDSDKYYSEFTPKYQNYSFDKKNNSFIIESNGSNKHGKSYKIIISK